MVESSAFDLKIKLSNVSIGPNLCFKPLGEGESIMEIYDVIANNRDAREVSVDA